MFDVIMLLVVVGFIFGTLFVVFKATTKINSRYADNNIGKVVATFPISYKMSGHIVRIGDKYYLCCEGCGIIEVDYSGNLDKVMDNPSFQSMLAKQFEKLNKNKNNK